jgi:ABC-type polysaccharide/polyol phosphate transport system ATPase subunit
MDSIKVERISKDFKIYTKPAHRLKELIFRKKYHKDYWALKDVSFNVRKGSTFGIIGENGSGKSTLLQIIAGTLQPTSGSRLVMGRVAALLELGTGFNPEFTGLENVLLNGSILGLSDAEIAKKLPEIERFAEIGEFIHLPVKTYSSGMYVRLAFSISINVDPEVLLVDEALAVGDIYFQQRCIQKIRQMRREGKTILLVSHDVAAIKNLCDATLWLDDGEIKEIGNTDHVVSRYLANTIERKDPFSKDEDSLPLNDPPANENMPPLPEEAVVYGFKNLDRRWGNHKAEILGVCLMDSKGNECDAVYHGDLVTVRVSVKFLDAIEQPLFGFFLKNRLGEDICGTNTSEQNIFIPPASISQIYTLDFTFQLPILQPGNYYFSVGAGNGTHEQFVICDYVENINAIVIKKRHVVYGHIKVDCKINLRYMSPARQ